MDRFNVAVKVVQNAGELLRQCRLEEAEVSQKTGHQDLVTRWDRRTEQLLRNEILTAFPRDAIVGEEYPPEAHRTGSVTWYIDPIDGTTNFINQHQNYAISVGCWDGSVPLFGLVLDVERKTLYWGKHGGGAWQDQTPIHTSVRRELSELLLTTPGLQYTFLESHPYQERMIRLSRKVRGVRCLGSVALELCEVAAGRADYSLPCALPPGITTRRGSFWRRPEEQFSLWLEMSCLWSRKHCARLNSASLKEDILCG